jgi:predicted transcriptional regulator
MQISLRVPPKTGKRLKSLEAQTGKTKTSLILEALQEKYEPQTSRSQLIRELAGWMSKSECDELRETVDEFNTINDEDWR